MVPLVLLDFPSTLPSEIDAPWFRAPRAIYLEVANILEFRPTMTFERSKKIPCDEGKIVGQDAASVLDTRSGFSWGNSGDGRFMKPESATKSLP
jgi:hypothetical protein